MIMKYRRVLLAVFLVLAGFAVMTTGAAAVAPTTCTRAEDFGAVPNDGLDDRVELQAAIDAAQAGSGCLELGPGMFHATRKPTAGVASIPSLRISRPLVLRGAGQGVTTLGMLGSSVNLADWWLLNVAGTADVTVTGLTLDGSQRTNTGEQTHLLQLIGPTEHVVVDHVTFNLPVIGPSTGGDCIRLLGTATDWVRDTTIRDTVGVDCDRSFVGLQRGVEGLVVERSESVRVGDQAVDFEPTGGEAFNCQPVIKNVLMRALTLRRAAGQGGLTVTIHGSGCAVARNVTLTDSVVEDGTVSILDAADVTLSRLHLRSQPGDEEAPVLARKRVVNLRILDSVIDRVAESGTGASIRVGNQSGAYPTDVLVSGVRVEQATPGALVATVGLKRLVVVNTQLVYTGPPVANPAVVVCGDATQPAEQPVLIDTTIQGALGGAVTMCGQFTGPPVLIRVTGP